MKIYPYLTICTQCDSVYHYRPTAGKTALCARCKAVLWQSDGIYRALPLTVAAAIMFSIACIYPVISVGFHGITNDVTLWQAAWALSPGEAFPVLTLFSLFLLVAVPFLQIILLAWLLLFARYRRAAPGFIAIMKTLAWLRPWSMVEVGVLGFLVAAVKLSSLLAVAPAAGGWALTASAVLIIIVTRRDLHPLWVLLPVREDTHHE